MKKILYMTQWLQDATFYYRLMPLEHLRSKEFIIERKPYYGDIAYSFFAGYHALILERPSTATDLNVMKLAKQMGLKLIIDFDDDILHVDPHNPMHAYYEAEKKNIIECLTLADEVWVSTEGIKHSFRFYAAKKTVVIPNCHNDYLQPIENKRPFNTNTKKAFWRGGASHEADVYDIADQLVEKINLYPEWYFQFIGHRFIYMEQRCGNNYQPVSTMPLLQYFAHMYAENPNIVFFPLCDTVFNKSKSNISYLESVYVGAAYFGQTNLTEFNVPGAIHISELETGMSTNYEILSNYNNEAWAYILDILLLSNVNKIREQRLLEI